METSLKDFGQLPTPGSQSVSICFTWKLSASVNLPLFVSGIEALMGMATLLPVVALVTLVFSLYNDILFFMDVTGGKSIQSSIHPSYWSSRQRI